jgi:hypothetical protein
MSGVKQFKKVPSGKISSKPLKAQPPSRPFLSAEFVQDTSDEDLEKSVSNSERSPSPAPKRLVSVRKVQDEALIATPKPKSTRPTEKNSKKTKTKSKPKPKSPSPPSTDSSATQSDEDDESGTSGQSEGETENSSESLAQGPKQQKPKCELQLLLKITG